MWLYKIFFSFNIFELAINKIMRKLLLLLVSTIFISCQNSSSEVDVKVKNLLSQMTLEEIYAHYQMPSDDTSSAGFTTSYTKTALKRLSKQSKI